LYLPVPASPPLPVSALSPVAALFRLQCLCKQPPLKHWLLTQRLRTVSVF
jgi:hypothetical protein